MEINLKKLDKNAVLPEYSKFGDAAMDLTAIGKSTDEYGNFVYETGLSIEIPHGYVGLIFPRSSVTKTVLSLANSVGVIDSGFRGEIICKFKPNREDFFEFPERIYNVGDRVAQIMIIPIPSVSFKEVKKLNKSERGEDGFGSTGV